jgi:DNA helicase IV
MDKKIKQVLYQESQQHVSLVSEHLFEHQSFLASSIQQLRKDITKERGDEREILIAILIHRLENQKQVGYACNSPYFVRCDVLFDDEKEVKSLYFGRFPFLKDSIYSWVAPAASIRFDSPGRFSYSLPDGSIRTGILVRKDQFMIAGRRIVFLSSESTDYQRELIYQEYFSQQRNSFILPEIVEQMEKAQDKVIRSHYKGSFLISGAAGSGKTTIALHRVAYLVQSPETEKLFDPTTIIVFVQDASTKAYFSNLLPELGIYRVTITTFDEWAMRLLGITNMQFVRRFGRTESEKDLFEYAKYKALQKFVYAQKEKDFIKLLRAVYKNFFTNEQLELFEDQIRKHLLDRFDLTVLLYNSYLRDSALIETVEKYVKLRNGKYVKKTFKQPATYSLIVVDEAENYLKEQLQLIQSTIRLETQALVYVGDLQQQTLLWTLKDWQSVSEVFAPERSVSLTKVYRNTRQILEYIHSLGYELYIPPTIREGTPVRETYISNKTDELAKVEAIIERKQGKTVGILAKTEAYLGEYRKRFGQIDTVRVLTINEAQGVEFDTVLLVGVRKEYYQTDTLPGEIVRQRQKVNRDLLYVAFTRAINELHIFGTTGVKELITK